VRFDTPGNGKQYRPLTLWRDTSGELKWRWKAAPSPRPLYGLDRLAERPDAVVVVCEGEKSAKAAARIFPNSVCIRSPGGAKAADTADWTPLAGRYYVMIWPDADEPGAKYAETVASVLSGLADNVEIIDATALASISPKGGTREPQAKWDAADALKEWRDLRALRKAVWDLAKPFAPPALMEPKAKFNLEPFQEININERTEWTVKRILPGQGVAAVYGRYGSFKSFVVFDIAMHVAIGRDWAGRRVTQAPSSISARRARRRKSMSTRSAPLSTCSKKALRNSRTARLMFTWARPSPMPRSIAFLAILPLSYARASSFPGAPASR
jgi:hypothetical protein